MAPSQWTVKEQRKMRKKGKKHPADGYDTRTFDPVWDSIDIKELAVTRLGPAAVFSISGI